jgi:predicted nucleotidyltransferase
MHPLLEKNKQAIYDICQKHFIKCLYVFGSITGERFSNDSDVDFLYRVDIDRFKDWATGSYDYTDNLLSFETALKNLLEREVDLVPDISIQNRFLKQAIEESKQLIYAA